MKKANSKLFAVVGGLAVTLSVASAQINHAAYIPAGSDLSTIKFQSVKVVKIAPAATDGRCEIAELSEPGGSMFCSPSANRNLERVYEVTYSYKGQPLASDEYNNTYSTFSVYFRPEELNDAERKLLSVGKPGRADAAAMFEWTTSLDLQARVLVDKANSSMCEGTYVDGSWQHTNPKCQDKVMFKTIAVPSGYVAVNVKLAHETGVAAAE